MGDALLELTVKKIPAGIRKAILQERFIDKAVNLMDCKEMEYLFDVYAEFIDASGEFDDWTCFKCREKILVQFRVFKPILEQLNNAD